MEAWARLRAMRQCIGAEYVFLFVFLLVQKNEPKKGHPQSRSSIDLEVIVKTSSFGLRLGH